MFAADRAIVSHAIDLRRAERAMAASLERLIASALEEVTALLKTTRFKNMKPFERARIAAFGKEVKTIMGPAYGKLSARHKRQLRALVKIEGRVAETQIKLMGKDAKVIINTSKLAPSQIAAIVGTPVEGLAIAEWWTAQGITMTRLMKQEIQLGVLLGESTGQLTSRIAGPRGVSRIGRRAAQRIVRTSVTAISAAAQQATYKANADVVKEYEYMATLDDRTSPVCQALDGQVFKVDDGAAPRPPQHQNCRSTTRPIVDYDKLGVSKKDQRVLATRKRASMSGPVSFKNYGSWLKAQSAAIQNKALGPTRAKMFRQGKVNLQDMVRTDGSSLTLAQLSRKVA